MNISDEIHSIKGMVGKLQTSVALLKQGKENDKELYEDLRTDLTNLTVAVNRLNLLIERKEGKSEGFTLAVKAFRILIGGLMFIAIIATVTFMFDINARMAVLESSKVKT